MTPLTIADLASRERLDRGHALPARLAVIGHPIAHSASPRMHQPALDAAGIRARYVAIEIEPGRVAEAFARMRELGFIGCNVTVPHKFEALSACDELDPAARDLGVANTIHFKDDGIHGSNTDGHGFEQAVREAFGLSLSGLQVVIVGAGGGAGAAIATHCARAKVAGLTLLNRTLSKIEPLAEKLQARFPGPDISVSTIDGAAPPPPGSLIVNTTSLGLKADDPLPLDPALLDPGQHVFDTIYEPPVTPLLAAAASTGASTANGLGMLLHQGARSFETWFPDTMPTEVMRRALTGG